jgi:glucose/mannose transport system substrate-binding protein
MLVNVASGVQRILSCISDIDTRDFAHAREVLAPQCSAGVKMRMLRFEMSYLVLLPASLLVATVALAEPKTDLVHQWASKSDAAAYAKLGEMFEAAGGTWRETTVRGSTADTIAKVRADILLFKHEHGPAAVQMKGPEIAEFSGMGNTVNLDSIAEVEGWDKVVAPELLAVIKPNGSWLSVPMNIHRANWIWVSKKAIEKAGITSIPATWAEFNATCEKLLKANVHCIAQINEDWSNATTFDSIVYGMNLDLYRKTFVQADVDALRSAGMVKAFEQYRRMAKWTVPVGFSGSWEASLNMMESGEAAFFFMGDWFLGELNARG